MKYCPNCGIRNPHFIESDQIINEFKRDIDNNTYFKSKVDSEIKKLTKNLGNKSFHNSSGNNSSGASKSSSTKGTNAGSGTSKSTSGIGKTKTSNIPKKTNEIICPKCGAKNNNSSNFCINCGLNLNKVMVCPKCGSYGTLKFCTECGSPLKKLK